VSPYSAAHLHGGRGQLEWLFLSPRRGDRSSPFSAGSSETGQGKERLRVGAESRRSPRDSGVEAEGDTQLLCFG